MHYKRDNELWVLLAYVCAIALALVVADIF